MYKVVIDPNIWISFLIGKKLKALSKLCSNKNVTIVSSPKIIEEFLDVSSRAKIKKYVKDEQSILNVFDLIKTYCVDDSVENIIVPALRDNDDLYLLALAEVVGANILLTGDLDLLTLKKYNHIEIISFSKFMARLL